LTSVKLLVFLARRDKESFKVMAHDVTSLNNRAWDGTKNVDFPGSLVTISYPASLAAEAYRALRTSLLYSAVDKPSKAVVVTSPGRKEGKSTTCANLGVVLAQAGKSTLIMDCDLREPDIQKLFGLPNFRGVVNVLAGEHDLQEVWQEPLPGLKVATTGPLPPNPAELLSTRRFAGLIEQMREAFDYVLIDAPPTGVVSDALILAGQVDGTLLVLDVRKTRKRSLRESRRSLEAVGANLLGTVVNNAKDGRIGSVR